MTGAAVGVDAGASRVRAVALDGRGRVRGRAEAAAPEASADDRARGIADVVTDTVRRALREAELAPPAAALCAGVAGAGEAAARRALRAALEREGLAGRVWVVTDAEAAHFDAFGAGPGILLAAGTGSVAWGRGPDGREDRTGGLGPLVGDEGSGWDLARRALRAAARAAQGRAEPTGLLPLLAAGLGTRQDARDLAAAAGRLGRAELSALAPLVLRAAGEGDRAAEAIVASGAEALAGHARLLADRLGPWRGPVPVALAGGLLAAQAYRRRVVSALSVPGEGARVRKEAADGGRGAARLARELMAAGGS